MSRTTATPPADRYENFSSLRALPWRAVGGLLCVLGLLLLVDSQWVGWGPAVRFGVFGAAVLATGGLLVRALARRHEHPSGLTLDVLGLLHAASIGVFLVVHGQTFQSGAGSETLLLIWTLLTLPWAVLLREPLTLLLTWVLGLTAGVLWILEFRWNVPTVMMVAALWCALGRLTVLMLEAHPSLFSPETLLGLRWRTLSAAVLGAGVAATAGWITWQLFFGEFLGHEGVYFWQDAVTAALFFVFTVRGLPNVHGHGEHGNTTETTEAAGTAAGQGDALEDVRTAVTRRNLLLSRTAWAAGGWLLANGILGRIGMEMTEAHEVLWIAGVLINAVAVVVLGSVAGGWMRRRGESATHPAEGAEETPSPGGLVLGAQVLAGAGVIVFLLGFATVVLKLPAETVGAVLYGVPFLWRGWRVVRAKTRGAALKPTSSERILTAAAVTAGLVLLMDVRPVEALPGLVPAAGFAVAAPALGNRWLWVGALLAWPWIQRFGSDAFVFWGVRVNILLAAALVASELWGLLKVSGKRDDGGQDASGGRSFLNGLSGLTAPVLTGAVLSAFLAMGMTVEGPARAMWGAEGSAVTARPDALAAALVLLAWVLSRRRDGAEGTEGTDGTDGALLRWRRPAAVLILVPVLLFIPEASLVVLMVGAAAAGFERGDSGWSRLIAAVVAAMGLHAASVWGVTLETLVVVGVNLLVTGAALLAAAWLAYGGCGGCGCGCRGSGANGAEEADEADEASSARVGRFGYSRPAKAGAAVLAVVAGVLAVGVASDAYHLKTARTVWAELRPVDPRDILMGDFMALEYAVDPAKRLGDDEAAEGFPVAVENGVLRPLPKDAEGAEDGGSAGASAAPGTEILLLDVDRFRGSPRLPRRFFFPQEEAEKWSGMRWAELACTGDGTAPGRCLLVRLTDAPGVTGESQEREEQGKNAGR